MTTTRRNFFLQSAAAGSLLQAQVTEGKATIFEAAAAGDVPRVTQLCDADPEAVHLKSADGRTALHFATAAGKPQMVTFLTTRGANLSAGPESPLLAAVDYPDHDVATAMSQFLIINASDPNARRRDGKTALQLAASRGYGDLAELLIHRGARVASGDGQVATGDAIPILRKAPDIERVHFARRYLQDLRGKPVERDDTNGLPWTLVNEFARLAHSDFDKVKQMLNANPGLISTRATWDELAVEAAAHMGLFAMAEWLADKGAPVSTCTAVILGLISRVNEAIAADRQCIFERGAHDLPILAYALYGKEQTAIADALLKAGANIHARAFNLTLLHLAASKGYVEAANLLIEHGADVNATVQTAAGKVTPLALAARGKQSKMEEFLKERGAKI
jgi:ankyrin repeat protein